MPKWYGLQGLIIIIIITSVAQQRILCGVCIQWMLQNACIVAHVAVVQELRPQSRLQMHWITTDSGRLTEVVVGVVAGACVGDLHDD
jgi:hypothetical protein